MIKVKMAPELRAFRGEESGIKRVVEAYNKYLPGMGIQFVDPDIGSYDLSVVHAGTTNKFDLEPQPLVSMLHGLYFTGDYPAPAWEYEVNANIVESIRHSTVVTVPSEWVGEILRRDMHLIPEVLPHGIDWKSWQHADPTENYIVAYAKNRMGQDVCDPSFLRLFAPMFPDLTMLATFAPRGVAGNVVVTGLMDHPRMKRVVQRAMVLVSTTKETFGLGMLEALSAGTPVVSYRYGGAVDLIQHGVNGYLAEPGNVEDLAEGLRYCMQHRNQLGANAREMAKEWTWEKACDKVYRVFEKAMVIGNEPPTVSVVIPVYNKRPEDVKRAIESARNQTYDLVVDIVVVDDGSTENADDTRAEIQRQQELDSRVKLVRQNNAGVAHARNRGIETSHGKYICPLDADDAIAPTFVESCVRALELDRSLGMAYTGLHYIKPNGEEGLSPWPTDWEFDAHLKKRNQVPTCCVFRKEMWKRLGGYRQRYAPTGAGAEDAEFFLRAGALGWKGLKVTWEGLFLYSWLSGQVTGNPNYREIDWLAWHPWTRDTRHPFASYATPKKRSHDVHQYDEPTVSVIIPVGPGHEHHLINALDSLEAQTFRKWEAIVVLDTYGDASNDYPVRPRVWHWATNDSQARGEICFRGHPFARVFTTDDQYKSMGAGYARNLGVQHARAPFLLFLDADDWLYPEALQKMLTAWEQTGKAVYSDYTGLALVENPSALQDQSALLAYDERKREAVIEHHALPFDCQRAGEQPQNPPYLWCNVTTLIPKSWHYEIGGFDESMPSWEDLDYWWRMAWAGKCFAHIEEPLLVYRFQTGQRRDVGLKEWPRLLEYLAGKRKKANVKMCNCSGNKNNPPALGGNQAAEINDSSKEAMMSDSDYVLVEYRHPNRGGHPVYGMNGRKYGYRSGGEKFLVHREDVKAYPHLFVPFQVTPVQPSVQAPPPPPPPKLAPPMDWSEVKPAEPPAVKLDLALKPENKQDVVPAIQKAIERGKLDLQLLPGVTPQLAASLKNAGFVTADDVLERGVEGLKSVKFVGQARAELIYNHVKERYGQDEADDAAVADPGDVAAEPPAK